MKEIFRNSTHIRDRSHDCMVIDINDTKVKVTYRSYNASEECTIELFNGNKWNFFLSMYDMGVIPDSTSYIKDISSRKSRADSLFIKAKQMCKDVLDKPNKIS